MLYIQCLLDQELESNTSFFLSFYIFFWSQLFGSGERAPGKGKDPGNPKFGER